MVNEFIQLLLRPHTNIQYCTVLYLLYFIVYCKQTFSNKQTVVETVIGVQYTTYLFLLLYYILYMTLFEQVCTYSVQF